MVRLGLLPLAVVAKDRIDDVTLLAEITGHAQEEAGSGDILGI